MSAAEIITEIELFWEIDWPSSARCVSLSFSQKSRNEFIRRASVSRGRTCPKMIKFPCACDACRMSYRYRTHVSVAATHWQRFTSKMRLLHFEYNLCAASRFPPQHFSSFVRSRVVYHSLVQWTHRKNEREKCMRAPHARNPWTCGMHRRRHAGQLNKGT